MAQMKTSITNIPEKQLADVLHYGVLENVRRRLTENLKTEAMLTVERIVDEVLEDLKGQISSQYDLMKDQVVFDIRINGVPNRPTDLD